MATVRLIWKHPDDYRGPMGIRLDGAHRLWRYKQGPSWVRSILLYESPPLAVHADVPTLTMVNGADEWILGGVNYVCEEGSWQHEALVDLGYFFEPVGYQDIYADVYLGTDT